MTSFNNGLKVNIIKGASAETITSAVASCLASKNIAIEKANEASISANSAESIASMLTTQASISTTQASVATTQATIATTKANESAGSASSALISKTNAATSEANALSYKDSASTSATIAITKANEALGYRDAALTYQHGAESAYGSTLGLVNNLVLPSVTHTVDTVDDFGTIPNGIYTVIVKDINRGGTFIYDATQSAVNNGGTIFDGWVRQYSGAVNVKWFGAVGDGDGTTGTDDTLAIQKAIIYCSSYKKSLRFEYKKTYLVSAMTETFDEASTSVFVALVMNSNLSINLNKSTIKMADNQSSDSSPKHIRMFFSNEVLENIDIYNGTIDMNGQNNRQNNQNFTQFHFGFSGTIGGVAARGSNIQLTKVRFINGYGVSCIVMAQSNTAGVILGKDWKIDRCTFYNNGYGSTDHSSIFGWATDVIISNNTFENPTPFGVNGGLVAYEVHGSNTKFIHNTIINYYQGLWVSINLTEEAVVGTLIYGNTATVSAVFVDFYARNLEPSSIYESEIQRVLITTNNITITDDSVADEVKAVFRISCRKGAKSVNISENIIRSFSTSKPSVLCLITSNYLGQFTAHDGIDIHDNNCQGGLSAGLICYFADDVDIARVSFLNNNLGYLIANATYSSKDVIAYGTTSGKINDLRVSNIQNGIETDGNVSGRIVLRGEVNNLQIQPSWVGITVGNAITSSQINLSTSGLEVNATCIIGSTTTYTGNIGISVPNAGTTVGSLANVVVVAGASFYNVVGNNDKTGNYFSFFNANGFITNLNPITLTTGNAIKFTGKFNLTSLLI